MKFPVKNAKGEMMALPKLVDNFFISKDWIPKIKKAPCYLYDFDKMGITTEEFGDLLRGQEAMLFEFPLEENIRSFKCCWCEYNALKVIQRKVRATKGIYWRNLGLDNHVYKHNKNPVDFQVQKFQKDLYVMRLELVRQGYHGALSFLVEHQCQICLNRRVKDRPNMCSIPEAPRNRVRSLKLLGYPIKEITKLRRVEWSILGVIVLLKV